MESSSSRRFTFAQLSTGLQILLILILVGSCAGASDNSVTDQGASNSDVERLSEQITDLEAEVRRLRREVNRRR